MSFKRWCSEHAVQHKLVWGKDEIPQNKLDKDPLGVAKMHEPGFRSTDKAQVIRGKDQVEKWLNNATERLGIHWVLIYLEPNRGMKENDPEDWDKYNRRAIGVGNYVLGKFKPEVAPGIAPPDPANTIVYIKPTSRVHGLTAWQQIHNIGHAVWRQNAQYKEEFSNILRNAVKKLQMDVYDKSDSPPTDTEVMILMSRLLDNQALQRLLTLKQGDLSDPKKVYNTMLVGFDELLFDLIASFLRNKGRIPLKPRGSSRFVSFDRSKDMEPNQELATATSLNFGTEEKPHTAPREWVYKALAAPASDWEEVSEALNLIVYKALKACTWGSVHGPIYPYGKLVTEP